MEVTLIEDNDGNDLPQSLANMLNFLRENLQNANEFDIFVAIIYILMLEASFIPTDATIYQNDPIDFNYKRLLALSRKLPTDWKAPDSENYNFSFVLPQLLQYECNLNCTVNQEKAIELKCMVKNSKDYSYSGITFAPSQYVVTRPKVHLKEPRDLAVFFKTYINSRVKCAILEQSIFRKNLLCDLPAEILIKIFSYLEHEDLANIGLTCMYFSELVKEKKLQLKLREDFMNEVYNEELDYWFFSQERYCHAFHICYDSGCYHPRF